MYLHFMALLFYQAVFESPIAPNCALRQGPICVRDAGLEVERTHSDHGVRIAVYAAHSPEQTAFIYVPNNCRRETVNSIHLAGVDPHILDGGRIFLELTFQVNRNCFIKLAAPSYLDREDNLMGLSLSLGLVRVCQRQPCLGVNMMDIVPARLRRTWFFGRSL